MAQNEGRYRGLPVAPKFVNPVRTRILNRKGKEDAKKYKNLLDFTRTHAIIEIDADCRSWQINVNLWYTTETESIRSGNARINVQMQQLEHELEDALQRKDATGRERGRTEVLIARLQQDLMNFEAQRRTNIERGFSMRRMAEEAMASWGISRESQVSIYTRARAIASGLDVSSVRAEIPEFEPVELEHFTEFEEDTAQDNAPGVGSRSPRRSSVARPAGATR
jgi:HPt (histidine-containing phosphotransfer) domain-containing protein